MEKELENDPKTERANRRIGEAMEEIMKNDEKLRAEASEQEAEARERPTTDTCDRPASPRGAKSAGSLEPEENQKRVRSSDDADEDAAASGEVVDKRGEKNMAKTLEMRRLASEENLKRRKAK